MGPLVSFLNSQQSPTRAGRIREKRRKRKPRVRDGWTSDNSPSLFQFGHLLAHFAHVLSTMQGEGRGGFGRLLGRSGYLAARLVWEAKCRDAVDAPEIALFRGRCVGAAKAVGEREGVAVEGNKWGYRLRVWKGKGEIVAEGREGWGRGGAPRLDRSGMNWSGGHSLRVTKLLLLF